MCQAYVELISRKLVIILVSAWISHIIIFLCLISKTSLKTNYVTKEQKKTKISYSTKRSKKDIITYCYLEYFDK